MVGMNNEEQVSKHTEAAEQYERLRAESIERSDTDGFVSQWANGLAAQREREEALLAEHGGRWAFPALFDLAGELVPAKLISTHYGSAWLLLSTDDPYSSSEGLVSRSHARKAERRRQTMAAKGYREGFVYATARVAVVGDSAPTGLSGATSVRYSIVRSDGGFSRDVIFARWDDEDFQ